MAEIETLQLVVPPAVLVAAVTVAGLAGAVARRRPRRRNLVGLGPGVVLFTSQRCPGCDPVRARLIEVLGPEGFREIKWTENPQPFTDHRIARVPTTAAVGTDGTGLLWEGMPPVRMLRKWKSLVYLR